MNEVLSYEQLKQQLEAREREVMELTNECVQMKAIIDAVTDLDSEPQYHCEGMGCGLEDRGITDRYDAMQYGWEQAMERVYGEVIPCAEELNFPATSAALAEVEAKAIEKFADLLGKKYQCEKPTSAKAKAFKHVVFLAVNYAAELQEAR